MTSRYAEYIREREDLDELETEYGFAHYRIIEHDTLFISDLFIFSEYRGSLKSHKITEDLVRIAKGHKCKYLTCMVDTLANNPEASLGTILKYGFKIRDMDSRFISFVKEL